MGIETVIPRDELSEIAASRYAEAERLFAEGHFAGAMFLAGSSLECYLKLAICVTLRLDGLPKIFKIHDFEELFLYSGFDNELKADRVRKQAYDEVRQEWGKDGRATLLYASPEEFDRQRAEQFLRNLHDPECGVIPWLKTRLY
ncbi:MAG: HEPN domain-containing protein [Phycisphaerae bacterium]|jgi:HEPN domain-containing protein